MNKNRTIRYTGAALLLLSLCGETALARQTVQKAASPAQANRPGEATVDRGENERRRHLMRKAHDFQRESAGWRRDTNQKKSPRLDRVNLVGQDGVISDSRRFTLELRADNNRALNFRMIW